MKCGEIGRISKVIGNKYLIEMIQYIVTNAWDGGYIKQYQNKCHPIKKHMKNLKTEGFLHRFELIEGDKILYQIFCIFVGIQGMKYN